MPCHQSSDSALSQSTLLYTPRQVRDVLAALSGGQSSYPAAPTREGQQQQSGDDSSGTSLRHLLDESKESLIEAERAFLSKALTLLQACPHHHTSPQKQSAKRQISKYGTRTVLSKVL